MTDERLVIATRLVSRRQCLADSKGRVTEAMKSQKTYMLVCSSKARPWGEWTALVTVDQPSLGSSRTSRTGIEAEFGHGQIRRPILVPRLGALLTFLKFNLLEARECWFRSTQSDLASSNEP